MAKKKKSRGQVIAVDDTVMENGVAISRAGRDRGPDHQWTKSGHNPDELVVQEIQAAAKERRSKVARRLDILERLLKAGDIERRAYDAGKQFKETFDKASLSGFPSSASFVWKAGGLQQDGQMDIMWRARDQVHRTLDIVGRGSGKAAALWALVGHDKQMAELSGGNRAIAEGWTGLLISALNAIADYYHPISNK